MKELFDLKSEDFKIILILGAGLIMVGFTTLFYLFHDREIEKPQKRTYKKKEDKDQEILSPEKKEEEKK